MKRKVVVIGLDGVTFNLIKPWVKEGRLPALARLMDEGSYGELKSTPEMVSPSAWTSFATGKNPGKHGIFNFMDIVPNTLKLRYLNSTNRDAKAVWALLNEAGFKTGVLNLPMTYPAEPVNGFMLCGWDSPSVKSDRFSHPPDLVRRIIGKYGDYPLFPTVKKHMAEGRPDLALNSLKSSLEIHASAARDIAKTMEWDMLIAFFIATDQAQHYFWNYMDPAHPLHDPSAPQELRDAILNVYKRCDQIIMDITDGLSDDVTVIVMSDHGGGINPGAVPYMPSWLRDMGYAVEKKPGVADLSAMARSAMVKALKTVYLAMNSRLPIKAKEFLNSYMAGVRDKVESTWRFSNLDWEKTRAFFHYEPRVNLKGREPFGIVNPGEEYEKLRDQIIADLYEMRDIKTGEKLVERVFKGEEVYHGPHQKEAPDMVIWWKDGVVISGMSNRRADGSEVRVTEKVYVDQRTGNHLPYGVFLAKGDGIQKGVEIKGACIYDIAPTVLYLMGVPVPDDMDGRVLEGVFTDEYIVRNPINKTSASSGDSTGPGKGDEEEANEILVERLKALGYME